MNNKNSPFGRREGESLAAYVDRVHSRPELLLPGIDYPFSEYPLDYGETQNNDS